MTKTQLIQEGAIRDSKMSVPLPLGCRVRIEPSRFFACEYAGMTANVLRVDGTDALLDCHGGEVWVTRARITRLT